MGGGQLLRLANILLQRGVYVSSRRVTGGSRAKSIYDTIKSEEALKWPRGPWKSSREGQA